MLITKNINYKQIPIIWDAHACPTLEVNADLSALFEYKKSGVNFLSVNVGFGPFSKNTVLSIVKYITSFIEENHLEFQLALNIKDINNAINNGRLAISFDLEGIGPLEDNIENLDLFHRLGIRQVGLAYNTNNNAAGGCMNIDCGLSPYGYTCIERMNKLGIVLDCSHMGYKSSLEVIEASKKPVVFSHSNPYSLKKNNRNIHNELIIACAKYNGVIGINGINIFLRNKSITPENIVDHICYICEMVGTDYVGLGTDYVFEHEKTLMLVDKYPENFPNPMQYKEIQILHPRSIIEVFEELTMRGFSSSCLEKIMGGNFFRVAKESWGPSC